jgi:hypothetical protein
MMAPDVAVIAAGAMGAAVGRRLTDHGVTVLTSLAGRSAATTARAVAAGMAAASDAEIAAADFVRSILPPGDAPALAQRFALEPDLGVKLLCLKACVALGGPTAAELLSSAIAADAPGSEACKSEEVSLALSLHDGSCAAPAPELDAAFIRSFAIVAAGRAHRVEVIPALTALLDSKDRRLRVAAAESVALLTNIDVDGRWDDDAAAEAHAKGRLAYEDLWRKFGKASRDGWLAEGFRRAGFKVRALDRTSVWELVRATSRGGHVGMNARDVLGRIAGEPPVPRSMSNTDACGYYTWFFNARRRRCRLEPPPRAIERACPPPQKS